jgi:hypothetical protein
MLPQHFFSECASIATGAHTKLEKRLTKIYRDERTLEEEQGKSGLKLR